MAKALAYNATLVARQDVTEALALFHITPDVPPPAPWFVPGQYCVLGLNNEAAPELGSVRRSMSIASTPHDTTHIEFYIRRVTQPTSPNPFTPLLWQIPVGARLYCRPIAAGVFTLPETLGEASPRAKVLVAAGTGAAPFVSMIRAEVAAARARGGAPDLRRWALLHGVSHAADLGYRDELERYAAAYGLVYVPTVSRPEPGWGGERGRVESLFEPGRLQAWSARLGLEAFAPREAGVLICGLQGTIGGTIRALAPRGFIPDSKRIREATGVPATMAASLFFEQYDVEPVINLRDELEVERLRAAYATAATA